MKEGKGWIFMKHVGSHELLLRGKDLRPLGFFLFSSVSLTQPLSEPGITMLIPVSKMYLLPFLIVSFDTHPHCGSGFFNKSL